MEVNRLTGLVASLAFVLALAAGVGFKSTIYAQQVRSTSQTKERIERLEKSTDEFKKSIDGALDSSRLDGSALEDQVNAMVDEFEYAADRLEDRADDDIVLSSDVRDVLRRGLRLDMFMRSHKLTTAAQRDWTQVRHDLEQLARSYNVAWVWAPTNDMALDKTATRQVVNRLEDATDDFHSSFEEALDRSRIDNSDFEDFMNRVVTSFERGVDRLEDQVNDSGTIDGSSVRQVLVNAVGIDDFIKRHNLSMRTRRDWARVKANLDDLAFMYNVAWDWTLRPASTIAVVDPARPQGERVAGSASMITNASTNAIAREVRHELLSDLPYYGVFDWIEFEVLDNTVVLKGAVTAPPDTKSRAEAVVRDVPGVTRVVNEIRVLPVSPNDDRLRRALYNEIYGFNSPLFRYGIGSRQAIHIIVDRGRATLKGVVDSEGDKQLAYTRARSVPGIFSVSNELIVDGRRMRR